jgi:hypothetical protein
VHGVDRNRPAVVGERRGALVAADWRRGGGSGRTAGHLQLRPDQRFPHRVQGRGQPRRAGHLRDRDRAHPGARPEARVPDPHRRHHPRAAGRRVRHRPPGAAVGGRRAHVLRAGRAPTCSRTAARLGRGWQSFDDRGVHFVDLVNVLTYKAGGVGNLGAVQLEWPGRDVAGLPSSTPIVVFAHVPLWAVYPQWGWVTDDAARALGYLKRFGSVTVLNGHIHQVTLRRGSRSPGGGGSHARRAAARSGGAGGSWRWRGGCWPRGPACRAAGCGYVGSRGPRSCRSR